VTIEKGRSWGSAGPRPTDAVEVGSDAEAREVVEGARRSGRPIPPLWLRGGDLCRTLGGPRREGGEPHAFPVDLGTVAADGERHWFVAHLVARRSWWVGPVVAAMNAEFVGRWDVAPRSHPNDGVLDVYRADLPVGERLRARRRLASGTHLPHPEITERRTAAEVLDLGRPTPLYLDSTRVGRFRRLEIAVEPDALTCVI
jgi:hypothetical protein